MLGCINATGCAFPPDAREATVLMKSVVEQVIRAFCPRGTK